MAQVCPRLLDTGLVRCSVRLASPPLQESSSGSEDNKKDAQLPNDSTGNSSPASHSQSDSQQSNQFVVMDTGSPRGILLLNIGLMRQLPTSGRKRLLSMVRDSNLGQSPSSETALMTGKLCGFRLREAALERFHPTSVYVIIGLSKQLLQTISSLLQLSELLMCSGDELALEKGNVILILVSEPGMKQVFTLTVKIRDPSGGMDTAIRSMLLSMNFVARSISPIYYDGWTGTRSVWSTKGDHAHFSRSQSGSLAIYRQIIGTPI